MMIFRGGSAAYGGQLSYLQFRSSVNFLPLRSWLYNVNRWANSP